MKGRSSPPTHHCLSPAPCSAPSAVVLTVAPAVCMGFLPFAEAVELTFSFRVLLESCYVPLSREPTSREAPNVLRVCEGSRVVRPLFPPYAVSLPFGCRLMF